MKLYTSLLLSLLTSSLFAQIKINRWENNLKKSEGAYATTGLKKGLWKFYYKNGNLEAEGYYNGQYASKSISVVHKKKDSAISDEKAMRIGHWIFYYDNGKKRATINYKDGCPSGVLTKWYKEEQKMEETHFIACKPIGNRKIWHRDGWLKYETIQKEDGKSLEVEYYSNGQKKSIVPFRNGQQYGKVKRWYPNGQKEEEVMMKNTKVHGSYRSWHQNGSQKLSFFSINNIMSGEYKEWSNKGILVWHIVEMTDENAISVKNFWQTGKLKIEGKSTLPNSLSLHDWSKTRTGYWTYYTQAGTIIKSEKYKQGALLNTQTP